MFMNSDKLNHWLTTQLKFKTDAEPELLVKYIIALIKKKANTADLKEYCTTSLKEFLKEKTSSFIDNLLEFMKSESYLTTNKTSEESSCISMAESSELKDEKNILHHNDFQQSFHEPGKQCTDLLRGCQNEHKPLKINPQVKEQNFESNSSYIIPTDAKSFESLNECLSPSVLQLKNVPSELNNISQLSSYFGKFGTIMRIQLHHDGNNGALVEFSDSSEARSAKESPDTVLNNPDIQVFWKEDSSASMHVEDNIDLEIDTNNFEMDLQDDDYNPVVNYSQNHQVISILNQSDKYIKVLKDRIKELNRERSNIKWILKNKVNDLINSIEGCKDKDKMKELKKVCNTLLSTIQEQFNRIGEETKDIKQALKLCPKEYQLDEEPLNYHDEYKMLEEG